MPETSPRRAAAESGRFPTPLERLQVLAAGLEAYPVHRDDADPADVATGNDAPAAGGDDVCQPCGSTSGVEWLGEIGNRETFSVWRCSRCAAVWSTRVRRATTDLERIEGVR